MLPGVVCGLALLGCPAYLVSTAMMLACRFTLRRDSRALSTAAGAARAEPNAPTLVSCSKNSPPSRASGAKVRFTCAASRLALCLPRNRLSTACPACSPFADNQTLTFYRCLVPSHCGTCACHAVCFTAFRFVDSVSRSACQREDARACASSTATGQSARCARCFSLPSLCVSSSPSLSFLPCAL